MHYHLFICHADEDKRFTRSLALALNRAGVAVWFDEDEIRLGSSIRQTIGRGLASAECGLVILSEIFFSKAWANRELNGLVAREMAERRTVIQPIWYELTYDDVVRHSPLLADQRSLKFEADLEEVVRQILDRLDLGRPYRQLHGSQRVHLTDRLGRRSMVSLTRKVQVGVEPLKQMLVRLPTSENYQLREVRPGEASSPNCPPRRSMGGCKI